MKFIPKIDLDFDTNLGQKLQLSATLILMEEAAQLIVCDKSDQLRNLICTMNLYQETFQAGKSTSTQLINEITEQMNEEDNESDLAMKMSDRICFKSGLKQLFFSFNVGQQIIAVLEQDMKLGFTIEKRLIDLIKENK